MRLFALSVCLWSFAIDLLHPEPLEQRGALRPQTFEQQSRLLVMKTTIVISDNLRGVTSMPLVETKRSMPLAVCQASDWQPIDEKW